MTARFIARFINFLVHQASPHFLMIRTHYRLVLALTLSLILHLAPLLGEVVSSPPPPSSSVVMTAQLRPPAAAEIPLELPEQVTVKPPPPPPKAVEPAVTRPSRRAIPINSWQVEVKRQLQKLDENGLFYPREAIAQGLEGETLILMIIDENGKVIAARVENGSGYPLLDDAALRAVRTLRSLPASTPRETLLPVRFRLK